MPLFKIKSHHLKNYSVATEKFSNTAVVAFAQTLTPKVRLANVANSAFVISGDTAVNIGGGYIVLTGTNFQSGAQVLVGNTPVTSTAFVDSTTLRVGVPARAVGTYNLFVVNPDGGTSIRVNGVTYRVPIPSLYSWRTNLDGELGQNDRVNRSSPVQVGTGTGWNLISIGTYGSGIIATKTDGTLWAWGNNRGPNAGKLGLNDSVNRSSPTQVGTDTNWSRVAIGRSTLATKTTGTLWAWGPASFGAWGNNSSVSGYRSSPVQVGALTNWNLISLKQDAVAAIKTDGTLWVWGRNDYGQLGLNDVNAHRSSPTQVGSGTNWNFVSIGSDTAIATKTDGTLWTWGRNSDGALGQNDTVNRSSPVQIGTDTNWSFLNMAGGGTTHAAAIKTDGTLWSWGSNSSGKLGLNDSVNRSSPTQVGTDTNWSSVSLGSSNTLLALKTNGTLWSWGNIQFGGGFRSSPVQVESATNWSLVSAGSGTVMAIALN
jgi:alpha-tubulin suppressor-like RCC1 family protein